MLLISKMYIPSSGNAIYKLTFVCASILSIGGDFSLLFKNKTFTIFLFGNIIKASFLKSCLKVPYSLMVAPISTFHGID